LNIVYLEQKKLAMRGKKMYQRMNMREANEVTTIIGIKDSLSRLSFDQLLKELGKMKLKLEAIIPVIFEKGKRQGLNEIEIRDKIKKTIDIPERTLNPYLPESAKKHKYPKNRKLADSANYNENREESASKNDHMESLGVTDTNKILNQTLIVKEFTGELQSNITSGNVYMNWTLDEFISKYKGMEVENEMMGVENDAMSQRLAEANSIIEELQELLEYNGIIICD
jgi:hypothetical protein